jgi:ankyrin repeat protein
LPVSLDETYERVLKEIGTANRNHAFRLLQCLAVAKRPLRVKELAEILALDFDRAEEGVPELKEDWRWNDQQEAVLSTCSSLIAIVNDGHHRVVQFSHFSVKEYLTSDRLATSNVDISHFHILPKPAHSVIAKACLGVLLRSDNGAGNAKANSRSPLAKYAAGYWVDHAQFEESTHLQVAMRSLFDPAMPYFEAWLELYDIDQGWHGFTINEERKHGSPLYYASLCGFRDVVVHFIAGHPQLVNATLGCLSPLLAALHNRHFDIAELLYRHGADMGIRGYQNRTLFHAASEEGFVDVLRWLLDHFVDVHSQQGDHGTPLHLTEANGHVGHCKSVNATDNTGRTPLHLASQCGQFEVVRLLIKHGANVNASDGSHSTPLHLASSSGSPDTVRVLIEYGANVNSLDGNRKMPIHLASSSGSPGTVRLLIKHGTDINALDWNRNTPLHLALSSGSSETIQALIQLGADVNARDRNLKTPLHLASSSGSPGTVQLMIEHGADVNARDRAHTLPLHLALSLARDKAAQLLITHGAEVNALDRSHSAPLHLAIPLRCPETMRLLIQHGADVNAKDGSLNTPLHLALSLGTAETVRLLIKHGADLNALDGSYSTPLHLALFSWSSETVWELIKHGADVNTRDGNLNTPLHLALSLWRLETVRLLLKHGADVNAQDRHHRTPLHLASSQVSAEKHGTLYSARTDIMVRMRDSLSLRQLILRRLTRKLTLCSC